MLASKIPIERLALVSFSSWLISIVWKMEWQVMNHALLFLFGCVTIYDWIYVIFSRVEEDGCDEK